MHKFFVHVLRLWNGNHQLSVAFWGVFIPVFTVGQLVKFVLKKELLVGLEFLAVIVVSLLLVCKVFSLVAVWRCAPNIKTEDAPYPMLARGVVILSLLPFLLTIFVFMAALVGASQP